MTLIPDEMCSASQNEWGTHEDAWYEDEGCRWCGTAEPNLVIMDTESFLCPRCEGKGVVPGADGIAVRCTYWDERRAGQAMDGAE